MKKKPNGRYPRCNIGILATIVVLSEESGPVWKYHNDFGFTMVDSNNKYRMVVREMKKIQQNMSVTVTDGLYDLLKHQHLADSKQ